MPFPLMSCILSIVVLTACADSPPQTHEVEETQSVVQSLPKIPDTISSPLSVHATVKEQSEMANQITSGDAASHLTTVPIEDGFEIDPNIWELVSSEEGVKTYREKTPKTSIVSFRGEAILHSSIKKIATVLNTIELRKSWVDSLVDTHTIEKKSLFDRIEYVRSKVPWPFQDRDFVFHVQVQVNRSPDRVLIRMNSVEDPRESPHSGVVRGELLHSYYLLKDISTKSSVATQVIVEIAADPKGVVPSWIVNLTQKNWPRNTLHSLEAISEHGDISVSPEIGSFLENE
jgi:hypothetical protein